MSTEGCYIKLRRTYFNIYLPVVGELQLQSGVVGRLDDDDVSEEVGPQQEADGLDDVGPLGFVPGQRQHGELLVGAQHHHLRAEHHPANSTARPRELILYAHSRKYLTTQS